MDFDEADVAVKEEKEDATEPYIPCIFIKEEEKSLSDNEGSNNVKQEEMLIPDEVSPVRVKEEEEVDICYESSCNSTATGPLTSAEPSTLTSSSPFLSNYDFKGKRLKRESKQIVFNVAKLFNKQKKVFKFRFNFAQCTSEATGLSEAAVKRILKEGQSTVDEGEPVFPNSKKGKIFRKKRIKFDNFAEGILRRKINEFYVSKMEVPTIKKLVHELKVDNIVECSYEFLRKKIQDLGFQFKKCHSNRRILVEKPSIAAWRDNYLTKMREYRNKKRNIIFLGATYLHAKHSGSSFWQSYSESGITTPVSNGNRLIIIHAGGESGSVNGALLIYRSLQRTGDYHGEINFENFKKWVETKLLPNVPSGSVIVMDNAAYHRDQSEKRPNAATLKSNIILWLEKRNVKCSATTKKPALLMLVNSTPPDEKITIDEIIKSRGHDVLHLPPYHPDLNPIELLWGDIKELVARNCITSNLQEKKSFCEQQLAKYSAMKWKNYCAHVEKIEEDYINMDSLIDDAIDRILLSIGEGSESTEDEDSSDED